MADRGMAAGDAVVQRGQWRKDPVGFVRDSLGATPWQKQVDILLALRDHRFVAVRSCNGSGKTYVAAHVVVWWLMSNDDAIVITTAPTQRQVEDLLWREIRDIHRNNRELIGGKLSKTRLELAERHYAFGFSTNTAERFQGFHQTHILFVVDEASGVSTTIFNAIVGSITSKDAKILLIGNPNSLSGVFYDAFHRNRKLWNTIHISAFDTPAMQSGASIQQDTVDTSTSDKDLVAATVGTGSPSGLVTPDWVKYAEQHWGKDHPEYQIRVLGEFPSNAADTLIPLYQIEAATQRNFAESQDDLTVMGVDVARFGDDKSVTCIRKGPVVLHLDELAKSDIMETTGWALKQARQHQVDAIYVDEVGLGGGVLDRMNEIGGIEAIGINGGQRPRDPERYANLRAELFDGLRLRFQQGDVAIPEDQELISQLASLRYSFTSRGQIRLEDKQALRSSGQPSPDKADALMLAFSNVPNVDPTVWIVQH